MLLPPLRRGSEDVIKRFLTLVFVCWFGPLAAGAFLVARLDTESKHLWQSRDSPRFVPVGRRDALGTQPGALSLEWDASVVVRGPQRPGRVTELSIAPGQSPRSGDPVMRVGRQLIVFQAGGTPLYRRLASGDQGEDVVSLAVVLSGALGRPVDARAKDVDEPLIAAIREFYMMSDIEQDFFDPQDVVYLPADRAIGFVSVALGQDLVGGEQLAATRAELSRATVVLSAPANLRSMVEGQPIVVRMPDGSEIPFPTMKAGPDQLAALLPHLVESSALADGLVIRRSSPILYASVPSSSVISGSGSDCIVVRENGVERTVILAGDGSLPGEPGIIYVSAQFIGADVLVNPGRLAGAKCG